MAHALKLSNHVLDMKFMKKSKEQYEKATEEEERKILFNSEIPDSVIKGGDQCIMEPSYIPCEQLQFGRFSFKGMNPEIERLMQENQLKNIEKLKKMDGISDKEMAVRYSTLINTMKKRFTPKRKQTAAEIDVEEHSKLKKKFQKPPEDFQICR